MTDIDRRTVLGALATTSLSAAAAGCSGGSGGGGTTTTTKGPFGVSNLVFVAEKPTGYMEYEEQPEATYEPGEVVWLYYNLDNVATEPAGEGEIRMDLSQEVDVAGPTGEVVLEDSHDVEREMPESTNTDELYFFNNVSLPSGAGGGEYELSFELTDEIAGETVSESATFTVDGPKARISSDGPFGVSNLAFAKAEPAGYREFERQPDATYGPGATVWLYAEVDGLAARLTESGSYETDLAEEVSVTGPDGGVVMEDSYDLGATVGGTSDLERYFLQYYLELPSDSGAGEYELSLSLTDEITGSTASASATFAVEAGVVETDTAFNVAEFVFTVSEATGYGDYEPQPDATYEPGDPVWMYIDVVGVGYERTPEGKAVRIEESITVKGPEGSVVYENTRQFENTFAADADLGQYHITDGVTTQSNTPTGDYAVEIALRDANTGAETGASKSFTLAN